MGFNSGFKGLNLPDVKSGALEGVKPLLYYGCSMIQRDLL